MIPKSEIIGKKISAVLESPAENVGVMVEEFGEAFYADFVIKLECGMYLHLLEFDLNYYTGDIECLKPATLEAHYMDPAHNKVYERSQIEGRRVVAVGGETDDCIIIFIDSGIGISAIGGPGGNYLSFYEQMPDDMVDYWKKQ